MSEIEHTPWKAVRASHGPIDIFDSRGYDIVTFYGEDNKQLADLFAAAPELLEALKVFIWPYQEGCQLSDTQRQELGRAAIAKATGAA